MVLNPCLGALFLVYVAFAIICVLNIVTGVFLKHAQAFTKRVEEQAMLRELDARHQWLSEVRARFLEAASSSSTCEGDADAAKTTLTWGEFGDFFADVKVQALFRKLGVDFDHMTQGGVFQLLDFDGTGEIDLDEFVLSMQNIHGQARGLDLARLRHEVRALRCGLEGMASRGDAGARLGQASSTRKPEEGHRGNCSVRLDPSWRRGQRPPPLVDGSGRDSGRSAAITVRVDGDQSRAGGPHAGGTSGRAASSGQPAAEAPAAGSAFLPGVPMALG